MPLRSADQVFDDVGLADTADLSDIRREIVRIAAGLAVLSPAASIPWTPRAVDGLLKYTETIPKVEG
jgi:hypothetical protein